MKIYKAYNLHIASELEMPELTEADGEPDIVIEFGKISNNTIIQNNSGDYLFGEMPDIGKFAFQEGRKVIIEPELEVDESLLRVVILGPLLCVLLGQRGLLVLHASAVNIGGQAVAFLGGRGWGKSTLATAFHTSGYNVLTDDVLPVKITLQKPLVFPAYPQFKVWEDAAHSLGHNTDHLSFIYKNSPKFSYKFSDGFQQTPLPLYRIYVLDKGEEHQISNVQPQEAFVNLVRHSRAISSMTPQNILTQHLQQCTQLVQQISFRRFTRKPALEDIPELVKMIVNDVLETSKGKQEEKINV
ncbi:hypothetical protein DSM106972_077050 [Dulcicalothrix desertica PCC 7102]|uniref:HPr kinase n=1 Tax=Dulcicalothrix desertica PCC 7102 TaxID=232991 RepID=A0A3S1AGF0_9CYAN|nr:hypothetical protein [Dulcicalothrix desertica]RUT00257.1 hypothetical protein DSM106972_077050 [Dulcicalothrix desertica PCC 7102]TWH55723.1 hypothetical protein CAL7102_03888 [Dulcicalothrix desertica PCC 7102]